MKSAIIDLQYGDSGKARVSAYFVRGCDWSIRTSGGPNCGHTVYGDDGRIHKFRHLPAGVIYGKKIALDTGMVINLNILKEEIGRLNMPIDIYISENVHIIQNKHLDHDSNGSAIGSTKQGIAYVYSDRALRKGIRVADMKGNIENILNVKCNFYSGLPPIGPTESAIYEGAQGIMLDIDYGCYPYVTSSSIIPSMAHKINKAIGVMKAYVTRVGDGPPDNPDVPELRELGKEYGTATGRPRKCTWLDADQIDYAISIVQPDEIVVTKLDILSGLDRIFAYDSKSGSDIMQFRCLDDYKAYLLNRFPQIKWFSESPSGDLIKVR